MKLGISASVAEVLAQQSGVISRLQAARLGPPLSAVDSRLRTERWNPWQRGVDATFSGTASRDAHMWAVALRAGPRAALS